MGGVNRHAAGRKEKQLCEYGDMIGGTVEGKEVADCKKQQQLLHPTLIHDNKAKANSCSSSSRVKNAP